MCGIAGIVKSRSDEVELQTLRQMTDVLIHRGPDDAGYWISGSGQTGLGHRRLSIIDLSENGRQPMHYAQGRYTITYNGEIYNYIELRKDLEKKGYCFLSNTDTEVLLALYHEKNEDCLQLLDGMFAFAIWDEKEQQLFCARDRFGEKPFYYNYEKGKHFCFASEMKALWAAGIPKITDPEVVQYFMETGHADFEADSSRTFFSNIRQLDAGHFLKLNGNLQYRLKRYYSLDHVQVNPAIQLEEACEQFTQLFSESVRLRLRSDVPVGSSLSGGIDSSSIVMTIDRLKGEGWLQNTFSARFKNFAHDEGGHIHKITRACNKINAYEVWPNEEQMQATLDSLMYHQEEPFASSSIFAQWKVMELARKNNTVVLLDGQGSDEYLAGYLTYYNLYLKQLFFTDRKKYAEEQDHFNRLRGTSVKAFEEQETLRMKAGRIKKQILGQPMPYHAGSLSNELRKHTLHTGLKELLRYADRNSMAHSREVRLPFLSHKLVEFAFSLPDEYKLFEGWTKYILRMSMKDVLPPDIAWRVDKVGYETPQNSWMKNPYWQEQIRLGREKFKDIVNDAAVSDEWNYVMFNKFIS